MELHQTLVETIHSAPRQRGVFSEKEEQQVLVSSQGQQNNSNNDDGNAFMFLDHNSVMEGWRTFAAQVSAKEQSQVLRALGDAVTRKFNSVGFCRERPVKLLSPFSVPLGPVRRTWMNEFAKVSTTVLRCVAGAFLFLKLSRCFTRFCIISAQSQWTARHHADSGVLVRPVNHYYGTLEQL